MEEVRRVKKGRVEWESEEGEVKGMVVGGVAVAVGGVVIVL